MLLRMSTLFLRTLREDPADAEVPSHKLLVRAGYIRRVAPGIYSWLPLGKMVLDNIAQIVREEMNRMGAQEVLFPALLPREYYEATGRWTEYGDTLFRLKDRKGADYLLGPTHEELFTDLVQREYSSYKDYPVILYQIQTKYRDEARPRAGILRGREFVMKDSYSFDLDDDGLKRSYELHREAYIRIFDRLGLEYRICSAMSGAMGGSASEEFLAPAENGEDTFVSCRECGYAANAEAVVTPAPPEVTAEHPPMQVLDTPDTPTIESLVQVVNEKYGLGITAADTLKNVVVKVRTPGSDEVETLVIGVPGDREVDFKRLEAALSPAVPEIFEAEDFAKHPGLVRGYIGPQILKDLGIRYLVDPRVVTGSSWVTGANEPGKHAAHVVAGRDFVPDGTIEAAEVRSGDPCPRCGGALSLDRGIEIGHIFQLGRKYSDPDHHGLVRHRRLPPGRGARRAGARRARPGLAARGRPGGRAHRRHRQGQPDRGRGPARRGAGGEGHPRARRRPPGRLARREVQGRRAARHADHPHRRPWPRLRRGRAARPRLRRAAGGPARRGGRPGRGGLPLLIGLC